MRVRAVVSSLCVTRHYGSCLKLQILNAMFIKKSRVFQFWGFSYRIIIILRNSSM